MIDIQSTVPGNCHFIAYVFIEPKQKKTDKQLDSVSSNPNLNIYTISMIVSILYL